MPDRNQRLSTMLRGIAKGLGDDRSLARIHNVNHARLKALAARDAARSREYELLLRFFAAEKARRHGGAASAEDMLFLVAVEYEFDDGARQGQGDAILVNKRLDAYVVESKILAQYDPDKRHAHAERQAVKYASRVASWMSHLARYDPALEGLARLQIHPMILTERSNRLQKVEMPGFEPGPVRIGQ